MANSIGPAVRNFNKQGTSSFSSLVSVRPLEAGWTRGGVTVAFMRRPPAWFRLSALTLAVCELLLSLGTGAGQGGSPAPSSYYLLCFLDPGFSAVEAELRAFSIFRTEDREGAGLGQPWGVRHSVDGGQFEESTPIHLYLTPPSSCFHKSWKCWSPVSKMLCNSFVRVFKFCSQSCFLMGLLVWPRLIF